MSTHVHPTPVAGRLTRRAWIAVCCTPVGFVASMVVGEGLLAMLGHDSADEDLPAGDVALAGGTAIVVFAIPCLVAWLLGRRAVAVGEPQGSTPALVGAVIGTVFVLLNLVTVIARIAGL